jgi:hypothetical protein
VSVSERKKQKSSKSNEIIFRIVDSDSEDEKDRTPISINTRSTTQKVKENRICYLKFICFSKIKVKPPPPRIIDWNAQPDEPKGDLAPSGRISSSSSSGSSSGLHKQQDSLLPTITPESPPVRRNILI